MRSRYYCCRPKARSMTYSRCLSAALGIQHAKWILPIILSSVACLFLPYFSTLSHKWNNFPEGWGRIIGQRMCFVLLYNFCPQKISRSKKNSARHCHECARVGLHVKCLLSSLHVKCLLSSLHVKCLLSSNLNCIIDIFSTNTKVPNFMKISPAGGEMFHADRDRQRDRHEEANSRVS